MNTSIRLLSILLSCSSLLFLSACKKETTAFDSTGPACKITVLRTDNGHDDLTVLEYDGQQRISRIKPPIYSLSINNPKDTTFYYSNYRYETNQIIVKQSQFSTETQQETESSNPADTLLLDALGRVSKNKKYQYSYTSDGYLSSMKLLNANRETIFTYASGNLIKATELNNGNPSRSTTFTYYTDSEDKYRCNGLGLDAGSIAHVLSAYGSFYGKASKNLIKTKMQEGESTIDSLNYEFDTMKRPIRMVVHRADFIQRAYTFGFDDSCY